MLRRFIISFSLMFAFANVIFDITQWIDPGNEWGPDGSKLGFYSSAVAFAFLNTFLWKDKNQKTADTKQPV